MRLNEKTPVPQAPTPVVLDNTMTEEAAKVDNSTDKKRPRSDIQPWQDEETLYYYWVVKGKPANSIKSLLGCTKNTVYRWADKYKIRDMHGRGGEGVTPRDKYKPWQDYETMAHCRVDRRYTIPTTASLLGCSPSSIKSWEKELGIAEELEDLDIKYRCEICGRSFETERGLGIHRGNTHDSDGKPWQDKRRLDELYNEQGLDSIEIAELFDCSKETVQKALRDYFSTHPCPRDGCNKSFATEPGMKMHYKRIHDESIAGVTVGCGWCGGDVTRPPSVVANKDNVFCLDECDSKWRSENFQGESNPNYRKKGVLCHTCETPMKLEPNEIERSVRNFCGDECENEWRVEYYSGEKNHNYARVDVECYYCSVPLKRHPSRVKRAEKNVCTKDDCIAKLRRDSIEAAQKASESSWFTVYCTNCGTDVSRTEHQLKKIERPFCSSRCMGEWARTAGDEYWCAGESHHLWTGGDEIDYGPGWNEHKKDLVRERDGRICQGCGLTEEGHLQDVSQRLHVHHITPARQFDDPKKRNAMENLVALCFHCHQRWEGIPIAPRTITTTKTAQCDD